MNVILISLMEFNACHSDIFTIFHEKNTRNVFFYFTVL